MALTMVGSGGNAPSTHDDPGLQPERTTLAWERTLLGLVTTALISLRWAGDHEMVTLTMVTASITTALIVLLTQRRRHSRNIQMLTDARPASNIAAVFGVATTGVALGALGLLVPATDHWP